MPRMSSANHGCRPSGRSVAGETGELTRIVEPFVHVVATNDRCCALLGPDDVQQEADWSLQGRLARAGAAR
jgi:hypothetical protein